ncbi:MAG TPA: OmpA family protein [Burkholderiales bacterium]|nr:OmpA family protein [Burkholderiales bacterium]
MLLVGAAVAACSSQTERGSTGIGAETTPPPAEAVSTPPPAPLPEPESVQFTEAPLPEAPPVVEAPPPEPEVVEAPPPQELPDFPITAYELPPEPEDTDIADLGPLTEPEPIYYPEQDLGDHDLGISEPEMFYAEQELAERDLGVSEPDAFYYDQELAERDLGVSEPEAFYHDQELPEQDLGVSEPEAFYYDQELPEQDLGVSDPTVYYDYPGPVVTVEFATEPLFNFDKYDIRTDQVAELDEFVSNIRALTYETIWAVGHTDRIGSVSYNQGLSERRANSIKSYLVRQGVPANKIRTLGRSKSSPVTGTACENERGRALISCLQPDRRVELSVTGTRAD